jgi:hypothetical protein
LVTNPPFAKKYEILKFCIETKKPFVLLLPLGMMATKKWHKMFSNDIFHCQIICARLPFIQDGRLVNVADCMWVYGNFGQVKNELNLYSIDKFEDDEELGSEDDNL